MRIQGTVECLVFPDSADPRTDLFGFLYEAICCERNREQEAYISRFVYFCSKLKLLKERYLVVDIGISVGDINRVTTERYRSLAKMTSLRSLTLARFSELLKTIERSSKVLQSFLDKEQQNDVKQGQPADTAEQLAENLGLPFHSNLRMVEEASVLRVACERLARLVTAPRHLVFESAGAVSRLLVPLNAPPSRIPLQYLTPMGMEIALKYDIATRIQTISEKESREGVPVEKLSKECKLGVDELG